MLLNCSNHISKNWSEKQLKAASQWGEIIDYPFPQVPAIADEVYISKQADDIVKDIRSMQPSVVMCQGEFTLSYIYPSQGIMRWLHFSFVFFCF